MAELKRTRLYQAHVDLGGRMVPFAGWELPVQYPTGPLAEHHAVRNAAGIFDIDHMGQVWITGPDAVAFLQRIQVFDVATLEVWDAHYSLLTYDDGTIVDDIFIYRLDDGWMVAINAANRDKDVAWLQAHTQGLDVTVQDISDETYMLAVQGPKAEAVLQRLTDADLSRVPARTALRATLAGVEMVMGRTGYTGEDGFELFFDADQAETVWWRILEAGKEDGLIPCGLAARDSLRFEACLPLYGHEIDAETNPYEARLGWVVSLDKADFVGREALWKVKLEKPKRLLVGLEMVDRAVPREGYPIAVEGQVIGHVTTGMKSPTLNKFLALGYVPRGYHTLGTEVDILVRDRPKRARVVRRPFYKPRYKPGRSA